MSLIEEYNNVMNSLSLDFKNLYNNLTSLKTIDEIIINVPIININCFLSMISNIYHINKLTILNNPNNQLMLLLDAFKHVDIDKLIIKNIKDIKDFNNIVWFLSKNTSIEYIDLSNNNLKNIDKILISLTDNTSLKWLDLSNNNISDIRYISEAFRFNTCIKHINLSNNQIEYIDSLCDLIEYNVIEELDVSNNIIKDIRDVLDYYRDNTSLKKFNLYNNNLNDESLELLNDTEILNKNDDYEDIYEDENIDKIIEIRDFDIHK